MVVDHNSHRRAHKCKTTKNSSWSLPRDGHKACKGDLIAIRYRLEATIDRRECSAVILGFIMEKSE